MGQSLAALSIRTPQQLKGAEKSGRRVIVANTQGAVCRQNAPGVVGNWLVIAQFRQCDRAYRCVSHGGAIDGIACVNDRAEPLLKPLLSVFLEMQ